ncbi:VSP [Giardia lamblia P15]|uniref:VSP n=1 Tax=Giardia intestinalis (strain P15) TaxID=658858 RepID=E1EX98_GIAIA|nr:VSP [Giardia lamblia P15]
MLSIAFCFTMTTLAAPCDPEGNHMAACAHEQCEAIGIYEVCTQCRAGGVPIDGFCRPIGSPQVITAGCTKKDGADLDSTATTCGKCGSEYFLFMGGCYKTGQEPGSDVCTTATEGRCTICNTDSKYVFQNGASQATPGGECVLCSDAKGKDGFLGVENCAQCTKTGAEAGTATCEACQTGYNKNSNTCEKCDDTCLTCTGTGATHCSSCRPGTYLKSDNSCSGNCEGGQYADPESQTCKACSAITDCTACKYNATVSKPQCTACGSGKKVKTAIDGATTCVTVASECVDSDHFKDDGDTMCVLCSDVSGSDPNKGIAQCKTCSKDGANKPECKACLDGYVLRGAGDTATCESCENNCAVCTTAGDMKTCTKCMPGYFLQLDGELKECIPCSEISKGGREGCSVCSNTGGFKCTNCKANYQKEGEADNCTCRKTCEDETACGGTAGACDAIVIDAEGKALNYCSYCGGADDVPINGLCVNNGNKAGNTCANGVCTQCAAGYFLYMGGCYDVTKTPGNLMCKAAGQEGICTEAASDKYFVVPGVTSNTEQSVLACANPLGTLAVGNAYVGVEDCSQCAAPDARSDGGMAVATCTACGEGRKPNKSGTGCAACSIENCRHCRVDDVCEECSSGFSLEGGKCISTGTSGGNRSGLSTGAIAGIAVAVVVVVGGLVGFLCWWFICRGKA